MNSSKPSTASTRASLLSSRIAKPKRTWNLPRERQHRFQVLFPDRPSLGTSAKLAALLRLHSSLSHSIQNLLAGFVFSSCCCRSGTPFPAKAYLKVGRATFVDNHAGSLRRCFRPSF